MGTTPSGRAWKIEFFSDGQGLAARTDDFGVRWSYAAGAEGATFPAPGEHPVSDLSRWREQIAIPDVDAMNDEIAR